MLRMRLNDRRIDFAVYCWASRQEARYLNERQPSKASLLYYYLKPIVLSATVCRLRGHDWTVIERGSVESGPCVDAYCERCGMEG